MDPLDFLDPYAAQMYRQAAMRRAAKMESQQENPLANVPEEEKKSVLSQMLDQSLGGLSYLGKIADKTFGGRALRGVIGGNPDELLSILPLSDTLGITDERRTVQGTDILANAGLITKGDESWQNQAAGLAAELALDPSTYLGFGPLTKAGTVASQTGGTLAKSLGGRIRAGEAGLASFGVPFQKTLFGVDHAILGTGDTAAKIADYMPKVAAYPFVKGADLLEDYPGWAAEKVLGVNPVTKAKEFGDAAYRQTRALFSEPVKGATGRVGQELAEDFYSPRLKELTRNVDETVADMTKNQQIVLQGRGDAEAEALGRFGRQYAEAPKDAVKNVVEQEKFMLNAGMDAVSVKKNVDALLDISAASDNYFKTNGISQTIGNMFTPQELALYGKGIDDAKSLMEGFLQTQKDLGINSTQLLDVVDYYTRQKQLLPRAAGEPIGGYFKRIVADFNTRSKLATKRLDPFRNIPGGTDALEQLVKDPMLSGPNRLIPNNDAAIDYLLPIMTGKTRAQTATDSPAIKWADELANTLHGLDPVYAEKGVNLFNPHMAESFRAAGHANAKVVAAAETTIKGIGENAVPMGSLPPGQGVSVRSVLEKVGLNDKAALNVLNQYGGTIGARNIDELKNMEIPAELAGDIYKFGRAWADPAEMRPVLQAWDMAANLFKAGVTSVFPAFHVRNLFSGLFNQWRNDALSMTAIKEANTVIRGGMLSEATAKQLFPNLTQLEATQQFHKELMANRIAWDRMSQRGTEVVGGAAQYRPPTKAPDIAPDPQPLLEGAKSYLKGFLPSKSNWETIRREYLDPTQIAGVGNTEDVNRFVAQGRALGSAIEDNIRTSHYLARRMAGDDSIRAAENVMKYQIDYSSGAFTEFENTVMKRLLPWYSFSRKNLPPILEDLSESPGKISAAVRLVSGVRDPDQFSPAYIAEGASIPVPGAPEGQQRYLSAFGLPIEDEALKVLGSLLKGDVRRTAQQGLGMANPLVKFIPEQAFGTQLFSGRRLDDLRPSAISSLGGILPDQTARTIDQLIANSPASRALHTAEQAIDPRKDLATWLTNVTTGLRFTDVDVAKQQNIAARELIKDTLRPSTEARVREEVYVPKANYESLSPTERFLVDLQRETNKKILEQQALERMMKGQR